MSPHASLPLLAEMVVGNLLHKNQATKNQHSLPFPQKIEGTISPYVVVFDRHYCYCRLVCRPSSKECRASGVV